MLFCCSRRTGARMVAVIEFVSGFASLILAIVRRYLYSHPLFVIRFLYSVVYMGFSLLLLSGVRNKDSKFIFTWLIWAAFNVFLLLISLIFIVPQNTSASGDKSKSANNLAPILILVFACCLHCVFTYVVYEYYKELNPEEFEQNSLNSSQAHFNHLQREAFHFPKRNQIATVSGSRVI